MSQRESGVISSHLDEIKRLLNDLPAGVDYEADIDETSPEDAAFWQAGIIWQEVGRLEAYLKSLTIN